MAKLNLSPCSVPGDLAGPLMIGFCQEQGLLDKPISVEDLFVV
ncbi:MAG: hypothetical protein O3B65_03705 [Chloroflexi bacterium]|nr:hypothetical protein [Chloroflexota bacterium]